MKRGMTALIALAVLLSLFATANLTSADSTIRVEAETMSLPSGTGAVNSSSSASGGKDLMIWANATATKSVSLSSAASKITVRAKGQQYLGAPHMRVSIDGSVVLETDVPQTDWTTFSASFSALSGTHQLAIAFTNDWAKSGVGDRNLIVDYAEFAVSGSTQTPTSTSTSGSTPTPAPTPSETSSSAPGALPVSTTLPPGSALPSDATCAARVKRSSWEPRPENATANHTTGIKLGRIDGADQTGQQLLAPRIDGNFTGTTDEIIQWAACKWGFNTDIVRAVAVQESHWRQSTVGDNGQSFGLLQIKRTVHDGTYPTSQQSTAFNLDYALAWRRACFEGYFNWVPDAAKGDEWGCVGLWYSGSYNSSGAQHYISLVKQHLADKAWLSPKF
jgi:predicted xylan-binding protein with Ca-dependent carbohydrate-binding module